jgi:hypothetical protein
MGPAWAKIQASGFFRSREFRLVLFRLRESEWRGGAGHGPGFLSHSVCLALRPLSCVVCASCRASLWEWLRVFLMHACVDDTGSEGLPVVVSGNSPATAGEANLPHDLFWLIWYVVLSAALLLKL